MNKKLFNILFLFVCVLAVSACGQNSDDTETAKEYIINGNRIVIPPYFRYVEYKPEFNSVHITLNVNDFQTVDKNYSHEIKDMLYIEIRGLRSEFGESKYWTKDDPVYKAPPYNCENYTLGNEKYKFCENGSEVRVVDWGKDSFTIYKNLQDLPVSVIGCLKKSCNVRAILSNGMQLEYSYKIEQLPRAFEIDYFVRQLVNSLIHPLENKMSYVLNSNQIAYITELK